MLNFPRIFFVGKHIYIQENLDPFTLEIYAEKSKLRSLLSISKQMAQFKQEKFPALI